MVAIVVSLLLRLLSRIVSGSSLVAFGLLDRAVVTFQIRYQKAF